MHTKGPRAGLRLLLPGLAVLPLGLLAWLGRAELARWATTGLCPAGPMDRPEAPCGLFEIVGIVFFGGWAAFLVLPVLLGWWALLGLGAVLARRRLRG